MHIDSLYYKKILDFLFASGAAFSLTYLIRVVCTLHSKIISHVPSVLAIVDRYGETRFGLAVLHVERERMRMGELAEWSGAHMYTWLSRSLTESRIPGYLKLSQHVFIKNLCVPKFYHTLLLDLATDHIHLGLKDYYNIIEPKAKGMKKQQQF
ncbi:hypothetical protein ACJX0J_005489 [Zea mays]